MLPVTLHVAVLAACAISCNLLTMINRFIPERSPEQLEQRLRLLKQKKSREPRIPGALALVRSWRWQATAGLGVCLLGASVFILAGRHENDSPINQALQQQAGFPLYVPTPLPGGLVYGSGLAKISAGTVDYTLQSIDGAVTITEQALPSSVPDFSTMGLSAAKVPAGTAYIGSSAGMSIGIVISNTTLISINADAAVPSEVVSKLSRSLKVLAQ